MSRRPQPTIGTPSWIATASPMASSMSASGTIAGLRTRSRTDLKARAKADLGHVCLYALGPVDEAYKIGATDDLDRERKHAQVYAPVPLTAVVELYAPGRDTGARLVAEVEAHLAALGHHRRGTWYAAAPELVERVIRATALGLGVTLISRHVRDARLADIEASLADAAEERIRRRVGV